LSVAVPSKGRLAAASFELLKAAGLAFETAERSLQVLCSNAPVELLLVRPSDIPEYVQDGVVDCGITGANLVVETAAQVEELLCLGYGRCTLEVEVPFDVTFTGLRDLDGRRIATSYPVSTRLALTRAGVEAELVLLSGSVEAAPRLGLADAVVDLVSSGSTAAANGLKRIEILFSSQAVLIAAPGGDKEPLARLTMMLEGVLLARRRRYLMLNAPEQCEDALVALLPSMGAPSVVKLAEPGQLALHAAVDVEDIWELLPRLKAAGATSILVLPLERVVP
jgi:ATP phosphoribosyltransferase